MWNASANMILYVNIIDMSKNKIIIKSNYHEDRIYTPEEYIRFRLLQSPSQIKYSNPFAKNKGISKDELKEFAKDNCGIEKIKSKATKEEILDRILEKVDIYELAKRFKIGVMWYQYAETFGLTKNQVVKLGKVGFLEKIDKNMSIYSREENAYEIKQFADMTKEMIDQAVQKYNIYQDKNDISIENINDNFEFNKELIKIWNDEDGRFKDIEDFAENPEEFMKRIKNKNFN